MRVSLYKRKLKKKLIFWAIAAAITLMCALFLERIYPNYVERVSICMENAANQIINEAVLNTVRSGFDFERITTDGDKNSCAVSGDTEKMNLFKAKYTEELYSLIEKRGCEYVYVPLGSLSRHAVFSGWGPKIKIKTVINGVVKTDIKDSFEPCGINFVKHKIYLETAVSFSSISAAMTGRKSVTAEIPLAETVISGNVPNYYGTGGAAIYAAEE